MRILGGIGVPELIIILIICLLIFGPKNLPKLGASLGKTMKGIRKGMEDDVEEETTVTTTKKVSSEPSKIAAADDEDTDVEVTTVKTETTKTEVK